MIHNTSGKSVSSKSGFLRLFTVSVVALVSVGIVAVPAHAAITTDPSDPTIQPGGPSPAITLTSEPISFNDPLETVYLKFSSSLISQPDGSTTSWSPINTCPDRSSPTTDRSLCGVGLVWVTDSGVRTDKSSAVKVAKDSISNEILVIFDPVLQQVAANTRTVEIVLASGAFVAPADPNSFQISMMIQTPGTLNANTSQMTYTTIGQAKIYNYRGVNFVGGTGSTGSMAAILSPQSSNLPANSFTRSGFTFSGWACSDGGEMVHRDQSRIGLLQCSTLYAVWAAVSSSAPATTTAPAAPASAAPAATTVPASPTPASKLATTGTSLSAFAPALALGLGWMLVAYSRSLRASRARHVKS